MRSGVPARPSVRTACALLLILSALSPARARPVPAGEPLTLDAALQTALQHNVTLAQGALRVERERFGVQAAREEFDTEISPVGSLNVTDEASDWQYGLRAEKKLLWGTELGLGVESTRYPSFVDENWRSAIKVDVRQPLFRHFGKLVNEEGITSAGERLRAETRHWELQKADLVVDVVRAFETLTRLRKQIACDESILERTGKLRELTRIRERQGRATRVDALRADLQWGQAQTHLDSHREEAVSAAVELAELLGQPADEQLNLAAAPLPDMDVPPMESAIRTALGNRLDYAQALDDYLATRRQEKLARRSLQPDLDLVAAHQQYDRDSRFADTLDFDRQLWTVGIAGQMNLRQHRDRTAVAVAALDIQAAREVIRIKSLSIAREVQQAASAYRQSRAELANAGRNHEAALARAELARRLFEMGRGDSFAATDADNAFIAAETDLLTSRSQVCLAGYRLLRAMGTLTETPDTLKPKPLELPP